MQTLGAGDPSVRLHLGQCIGVQGGGWWGEEERGRCREGVCVLLNHPKLWA